MKDYIINVLKWLHNSFKFVGTPTWEEQIKEAEHIKKCVEKARKEGYRFVVSGKGAIRKERIE